MYLIKIHRSILKCFTLTAVGRTVSHICKVCNFLWTPHWSTEWYIDYLCVYPVFGGGDGGSEAKPDHHHGRDEDGEAKEQSREAGLLGDTAQPVGGDVLSYLLDGRVHRVHLRVLHVRGCRVVHGSQIGLYVVGGLGICSQTHQQHTLLQSNN